MSCWNGLETPAIVLSTICGASVSFLTLTKRGREAWLKFRDWRTREKAKRIAAQHKDLAEAVAQAVRLEIQPVRHEFEDNGGTGLKERFVNFEGRFGEFRIEATDRLTAIEAEQQNVKKEVSKQAERVDNLLLKLAAGGRS
jgi:hypothetical protein